MWECRVQRVKSDEKFLLWSAKFYFSLLLGFSKTGKKKLLLSGTFLSFLFVFIINFMVIFFGADSETL